jgi:pilus assembly protein Flp/PilA
LVAATRAAALGRTTIRRKIGMVFQVVLWVSIMTRGVRRRFTGKDDVGASLVEYALLLALVAVVAIGALVFLGNSVHNTLNEVGNEINNSATVTT